MSKRKPTVDERLVTDLSGPKKLWALLQARGHTYVSLSKKYGLWPQHVKNTVYGERYGADVREALARELDLTREVVDRLLDEEREPATATKG